MATPTYTLIDSVTLGSSASSVTFSAIPAGGDLVLVAEFNSNSLGEISMSVNTAGTIQGEGVVARGNGSSASSGTTTGALLPLTSNIFTDTGGKGLLVVQVMDYSATDKHKSILARFNVASGSSYPGTSMMAGRYATTAAITALQLKFGGGQQFQSGNTFFLYNIAKAL